MWWFFFRRRGSSNGGSPWTVPVIFVALLIAGGIGEMTHEDHVDDATKGFNTKPVTYPQYNWPPKPQVKWKPVPASAGASITSIKLHMPHAHLRFRGGRWFFRSIVRGAVYSGLSHNYSSSSDGSQ